MIIAVIGGSTCPNKTIEKLAFQTGIEIARRGHILICGGMSGVMEFACKGAKTVKGSITVGILPGKTKQDANPYVDIPVITAMSHARNAIIVRTADAVIAIDGKYGTLSEIALAKVLDKPVYGIKTWDIEGVIPVSGPKEALDEIEKNVVV